jgi:hypothetical protein
MEAPGSDLARSAVPAGSNSAAGARSRSSLLHALLTRAVDRTAEVNALAVLNDLSIASPSFKLEDFRYNHDRKEAYFTLVQDISDAGDAFALFESLKAGLTDNGYTVEYSANQDKDVFRARFKSVYGGQG